MSAANDASDVTPQARSGVGFGSIVRLLAIAVGIMSAALMAVSGFKVPVNQAFMEGLEGVRELVGTAVWPFDKLIVTPIVNWLHGRGIVFDLQIHWQYVFVLTWLFLAAWARSFSSARDPLGTAFRWFWAGVSALIAGGLAGSVPLSDSALLFWPFAGFGLFFATFAAWTFARSQRLGWGLLALAGIGVAAASSALALHLIEGKLFAFEAVPSPGLANLAFVIAALAISYIFAGLDEALRSSGDGFTLWQRFFGSAITRVGLDILSVLGGAAFIVWLGHTLA